MAAYMILALGACVVSIMAGLSEVWAAPISQPEPPVKPQLPPEVVAVMSRNAPQDVRGDPLGPGRPKAVGLSPTRSAPLTPSAGTLYWSAISSRAVLGHFRCGSAYSPDCGAERLKGRTDSLRHFGGNHKRRQKVQMITAHAPAPISVENRMPRAADRSSPARLAAGASGGSLEIPSGAVGNATTADRLRSKSIRWRL